MKKTIFLAYALFVCFLGWGQETVEKQWEFVRRFEEQTIYADMAGFDFNEDGDLVMYDTRKSEVFVYSKESDFHDWVSYPLQSSPPSGSNIGAWYNNGFMMEYTGPRFFYFINMKDLSNIRIIDPGVFRNSALQDALSNMRMIPFGNLVILERSQSPGEYHSLEVDMDGQVPSLYRTPEETRRYIEENGEELGLYFNESDFLFHDSSLLTASPDTFERVYSPNERRVPRAFGSFMGFDRAGNYYWGGISRIVATSETGEIIGDVLVSGSIQYNSQMRVSPEGWIYVFEYDLNARTLDLYRVDTGVLSGE